MSSQFSLEEFYHDYGLVEEAFQAALDVSLEPRGPELLYDLVDGLHLPPGASALDVGCGEGRHSLALAERFGFDVTGIDPVPRQVELAGERLAAAPGLGARVRFELGTAEALPVGDGAVDFVWCRDVLVHVAALDDVYREFRRVLREGGRALVYQSSFATDRLEPREAGWLFRTNGAVSADPARTEAAIAGAGLRVDERIEVGLDWGEWFQERTGSKGRRLLHTARLLHDPGRYVEQFGQRAYDIMLGDCLWHVYHMLGKLGARVYLLSR